MYVFVAGSLPELGEDNPEIAPPVIETLLEACVEIVPKPKLVLDVEAELTSDKLFDAVSFPVI